MRKPSVKFWLLTPTLNQVLRLAILKTILRRKKKKRINNNNNSKPQQKSKQRLQQVADYQTGDCLKEGTQIFILLSVQQKVWKNVRLHTSTKTPCHCLCWCFSQKFFIAGWTDQRVLPATLKTDKPDLAADCLTLHCWTWWISLPQLCRRDTHWITHYMTTSWDSDRYTMHFMARPWHETDFYTYCVFCILCTIHRDLTKAKNMTEWLWKLRTVFDKLNEAYAKFYNPSEHLALDKVIAKFKGRVIFRQYIPKKRKCAGIKIYKLWWIRVYAWHESVLRWRLTLRHWWHDCNTCTC